MVALSGCATAGKMNELEVGMSRSDVTRTMGLPASVSAKDNEGTYLTYRLFESELDWWKDYDQQYFVRLVGGRVDAFGKKGDFNSTTPPPRRIEIDSISHVALPAHGPNMDVEAPGGPGGGAPPWPEPNRITSL